MLAVLAFNSADLTQAVAISITGYFIVFVALVLLNFSYNYYPLLLKIKFKRKKTGSSTESTQVAETDDEISGEMCAAISAAVFLVMSEDHDEENTIVTIKRVSRTYSPWSSKIYGVGVFNK